MAKFKTGDRVRCTKPLFVSNPRYGVSGGLYRVTAASGNDIQIESLEGRPTKTDWWCADDRFELVPQTSSAPLAVGDKVILKNRGPFLPAHIVVGTKGTIERVLPTTYVIRFDGDYMGRGVNHDRIEKALAEPVFKIGDRVRFRNSIPDTWWFKPGQTGTITENVGGTYQPFRVKVDNGMRSWPAHVGSEHIELIPAAPARPFKVGDRVRITGFCPYDYSKHTGKVGTIREDDGKAHKPFRVDLGDDEIWRDAEHLELVPTIQGSSFDRIILDELYKPGPSIFMRPGSVLPRFPSVPTFPLVRDIPHIVILQKGTDLAPSASPKVHPSKFAAEAEAKRLAKLHPGSTFAVFRAVSKVAAEEPAVKVEVLP